MRFLLVFSILIMLHTSCANDGRSKGSPAEPSPKPEDSETDKRPPGEESDNVYAALVPVSFRNLSSTKEMLCEGQGNGPVGLHKVSTPIAEGWEAQLNLDHTEVDSQDKNLVLTKVRNGLQLSFASGLSGLIFRLGRISTNGPGFILKDVLYLKLVQGELYSKEGGQWNVVRSVDYEVTENEGLTTLTLGDWLADSFLSAEIWWLKALPVSVETLSKRSPIKFFRGSDSGKRQFQLYECQREVLADLPLDFQFLTPTVDTIEGVVESAFQAAVAFRSATKSVEVAESGRQWQFRFFQGDLRQAHEESPNDVSAKEILSLKSSPKPYNFAYMVSILVEHQIASLRNLGNTDEYIYQNSVLNLALTSSMQRLILGIEGWLLHNRSLKKVGKVNPDSLNAFAAVFLDSMFNTREIFVAIEGEDPEKRLELAALDRSILSQWARFRDSWWVGKEGSGDLSIRWLRDFDGDRVIGLLERSFGSSDKKWDTDGDGWTDLAEIFTGTGLADKLSFPNSIVLDGDVDDWLTLNPKTMQKEATSHAECTQAANIKNFGAISMPGRIVLGAKSGNSYTNGLPSKWRIDVRSTNDESIINMGTINFKSGDNLIDVENSYLKVDTSNSFLTPMGVKGVELLLQSELFGAAGSLIELRIRTYDGLDGRKLCEDTGWFTSKTKGKSLPLRTKS